MKQFMIKKPILIANKIGGNKNKWNRSQEVLGWYLRRGLKTWNDTVKVNLGKKNGLTRFKKVLARKRKNIHSNWKKGWFEDCHLHTQWDHVRINAQRLMPKTCDQTNKQSERVICIWAYTFDVHAKWVATMSKQSKQASTGQPRRRWGEVSLWKRGCCFGWWWCYSGEGGEGGNEEEKPLDPFK